MLDTDLYSHEDIAAFFGHTQTAAKHLFDLRQKIKAKRFPTDHLDQSLLWLHDVQHLLLMAGNKKKIAEGKERSAGREDEMVALPLPEMKRQGKYLRKIRLNFLSGIRWFKFLKAIF
ncbi:hypothetical protein PV783_24710 [Chitinophaga sp. CC14]|uniref:hypothetical protein n=1 Tax=Chitinophaga sp. CC14 TaxID=3029199 RepID=UPI003B810384